MVIRMERCETVRRVREERNGSEVVEAINDFYWYYRFSLDKTLLCCAGRLDSAGGEAQQRLAIGEVVKV